MQSKEIRQQFLDFFKERGHTFVSSAPVLPAGDQTLLFTNAGMNQFKDIFLGKRVPEYKRAVNSQKCIRVSGKHNDLEEVGRDTYHHTFFEMLGTWSFGDYYKKEAISWAWELFTGVWKLPKDRLYATVHKSDQEAYDLWKANTDIEHSHIMYFGDKENFWEMGETGPCGPCSEIHIDLGAERCDKKHVPGHVCAVNGGCARYIELWNLVFIQYNRQENRELLPLKDKHVDTGAGFERICAVLQNVRSNYDTDLFVPIIKEIETLSGVKYFDDDRGTPHRAIADHIRMSSFAIADGVLPSNDGRGYVVRRILRRGLRYGRKLGMHKPFMFKLVPVLAGILGDIFPEILTRQEYAQKVIQAEENSFNKTLDRGLEIFEEIQQALKKDNKTTIPGADVFKLYDTFGFPPDLTNLLAEEKGLMIDQAGFEAEMNKQKERARAGSLGTHKGIGGEIVVESGSAEEKKAMARHHTATHLLHAALQKVLGAHATQSGSLVNPERLRFDFAHFQAMTPEELKKVEELVNAEIKKKADLNIFEAKYLEAKQLGAMSLFGEKYGDVVRVVQIGDFSKELCGGTHVKNTGELEEFKIIKECSISAGVRRIEALAGTRIIENYNTQQNAAVAEQQKREEQKAAQKQREKELLKNTLKELDNFVKQQEVIAGKKTLIFNIGQATNEIVRTVADSAAQVLGESIVLLGAEDNGKVILVAKVSPKLITKELNANILVKKAAEIVGGGGGGKPEQAQAGGSKPEKLAEALSAAKELVARSA